MKRKERRKKWCETAHGKFLSDTIESHRGILQTLSILTIFHYDDRKIVSLDRIPCGTWTVLI
jgi:hypothetical protein